MCYMEHIFHMQVASKRVLNLLESTAQLVREAEANIEQCREVEGFFSAWQQTKMNTSLFYLTNFSVGMIPIQTFTGWYGMNFAHPGNLNPKLTPNIKPHELACIPHIFLVWNEL